MITRNSDRIVDIEVFQRIKNHYNFLVDFMYFGDSPPRNKSIRESPGVLGELFRDIKEGIDKEDLYKLEYEVKIKKKYSLEQNLYQNPKI